MRKEWTNMQRRQLRELAGKAYEIELAGELENLETEFFRWRRGEIDVHELSDRIHQFHEGPARNLFLAYTDTAHEIAVGSAIGRGILSEKDAPPDLLAALKGFIELIRDDWNKEQEG